MGIMFVIIIILILIVLLVIYVLQEMKRPRNFPPGPIWWPFVSNFIQLKKLSTSLGGQNLALLKLAKEYTTDIVGLKLGKELVVVVFNYTLVKEVLLRDEFIGRPHNFFFKMRSLGKRRGITGTDGEAWNTHRNFALLHLRNLELDKNSMETLVLKEVTTVLSLLEVEESNIEVTKFLAPGVLNILWTLVAGKRLSTDDDLLNELLELLTLRKELYNVTGGILNMYPWLRYIAPQWSGYSLIRKTNETLKSFIGQIVHEHYERWEEGRSDDFIYSYISEIRKDEADSVFNDDELVAICLDFLISGTQTTSKTLEFALQMMTMYPDIQKKVQEEIDTCLDKNIVLDYSDRKKLPYVNAVLMETERCHNVVPVIGPRRALKSTTLAGYFVPKNTTVLASLYSIHHSEEYWDDPDAFKPERFLEENGKLLSPEKLIPFGLGKRRCLGENFAKQCIFFFFVEILRKFSLSFATDLASLSETTIPVLPLHAETYPIKFSKR